MPLHDLWVLQHLIFCSDLHVAQMPASWSSQTALHAWMLRAEACKLTAASAHIDGFELKGNSSLALTGTWPRQTVSLL